MGESANPRIRWSVNGVVKIGESANPRIRSEEKTAQFLFFQKYFKDSSLCNFHTKYSK